MSVAQLEMVHGGGGEGGGIVDKCSLCSAIALFQSIEVPNSANVSSFSRMTNVNHEPDKIRLYQSTIAHIGIC